MMPFKGSTNPYKLPEYDKPESPCDEGQDSKGVYFSSRGHKKVLELMHAHNRLAAGLEFMMEIAMGGNVRWIRQLSSIRCDLYKGLGAYFIQSPKINTKTGKFACPETCVKRGPGRWVKVSKRIPKDC